MDEAGIQMNCQSSVAGVHPTIGGVAIDDKGAWWQRVFRGFWSWLLVAVGFVSGILAIVHEVVGRNAEPLFAVCVSDRQCITELKNVPELRGSFEFSGRKIKNLWTMKVDIANRCSRSIVGTGNGSDLIYSNVCFRVSPTYRILSINIEKNEFNASVTSLTNGFLVAFERCRPGKSCVARLYCECDDAQSLTNLNVYTDGEVLSRGEAVVFDCNDDKTMRNEVRNVLCWLPPWLHAFLRWISVAFFVLIFVITFFILFVKIPWVRILRRLRWERLYGQAYSRILNKSTDNNEAYDYKRGLEKTPKDFWDANGIPQPPMAIPFFDVSGSVDRTDLVKFSVLMFVISLFSLIAILALVYV